MPKVSNSSGTRSRAARRLEPYNKSPVSGERSQSRLRHERRWAGDLLEQQKQYAKELKKMKNELNAAKHSKPEKLSNPEPEFKFEGNKKQYKVNQHVLDQISEVRNTSDDEERSNLLLEGEKLLLERNKHICLADKYGWDTVECYTVELLASDSGDEKSIKKAIKESKQLPKEKRKMLTAKWKTKKLPQQDERQRRVF